MDLNDAVRGEDSDCVRSVIKPENYSSDFFKNCCNYLAIRALILKHPVMIRCLLNPRRESFGSVLSPFRFMNWALVTLSHETNNGTKCHRSHLRFLRVIPRSDLATKLSLVQHLFIAGLIFVVAVITCNTPRAVCSQTQCVFSEHKKHPHLSLSLSLSSSAALYLPPSPHSLSTNS